MHPADFAKLYREYRPELMSYASFRCGDTVAAKDIVQLVFLKLLEKDGQQEVRDWKSYLYTMVRNETINYLRSKKKVPVMLSGESKDSHQFENFRDVAVEKEQRTSMLETIAALPPQESVIYELHWVYDWKREKVAKAMGCSNRAVSRQIRTIRRKLEQIVR